MDICAIIRPVGDRRRETRAHDQLNIRSPREALLGSNPGVFGALNEGDRLTSRLSLPHIPWLPGLHLARYMQGGMILEVGAKN